jgi:hypothetical protein
MNTTQWEYLVLDRPAPAQLNALGRQGWELVSVTCVVSGFSRDERAFLKRLISTPPAGLGGR